MRLLGRLADTTRDTVFSPLERLASRRFLAERIASVATLFFVAGAAGAQNLWTVTIRPAATAIPAGICTPIRLDLRDAGGQTPRNPAGVRVSIADFDWSVAPAGKVVGRYDGASAWSACACLGADGTVATITATYPAQTLSQTARVPGVTFTSSITVPVAASGYVGVPIGCEKFATKTAPAGGQMPWTVTLTSHSTPIPIGNCSSVQLDLRDATGKEAPRDPTGRLLSIGDFDWSAAPAGTVAGQSDGANAWSVCACQGAKVGGLATINASYPARALADAARVPGVAFQSSLTVPLAAPNGTFNPPACLATVVATAPPAPTLQTAPAAPVLQTAPAAPAAPAAPTPLPAQRIPVAFKTGVAPTNVAARAGTKSVVVSWSPVATPRATYRLRRSESAATPGGDLATLITGTSFVDLTVVLGATYYYQVSADDGSGSIGSAAPVAITVLPASAATPRLIATGTTGIGKLPVGTGTQVPASAGPAPDPFSVSGGAGGTMIFPWPTNLDAVAAAGASSISVSRWVKSNPDCCRLILPDPDLYYVDSFGQSDPFGIYIYRMTINYSDGRQGIRDATFNRVRGNAPTGFTATSTGAHGVQLGFIMPTAADTMPLDFVLSGPGIAWPQGFLISNWGTADGGHPGLYVNNGVTWMPIFAAPSGAGTWKLTPFFWPGFADTTLTVTAKAVIP
jgi:hypothetical protein